jgi:DNA-binding CsgD family transcriptional regulator
MDRTVIEPAWQAGRDMWEQAKFPHHWSDTTTHEPTMSTAPPGMSQKVLWATRKDGTRLSWDEVLAKVDALIEPLTESCDAPSTPTLPHGLTPRELEVLQLVAAGHSNRAIGDLLFLSDRTVENHVRHIMAKLSVNSRTAAATWAVRHGLA